MMRVSSVLGRVCGKSDRPWPLPAGAHPRSWAAAGERTVTSHNEGAWLLYKLLKWVSSSGGEPSSKRSNSERPDRSGQLLFTPARGSTAPIWAASAEISDEMYLSSLGWSRRTMHRRGNGTAEDACDPSD